MDPQRLADLLGRHATALALYAARWTPVPDDVDRDLGPPAAAGGFRQ